MGKAVKHLCGWKKKERLRNLDRYRRIVRAPRFMCEECGRVAAGKKWLCEPVRLSKD